MRKERHIRSVPKVVLLVLPLMVAVHLVTRALAPLPVHAPEDLETLPDNKVIQSAFFGDGVLAARWLILWLQAHDTQSGTLLANRDRDYQRLSDWLIKLSQLDSHSHYPLLLAGRVYSQTSSTQHIRIMLATVNKLFKNSPGRFWRWQAEAAILAKHRLHDTHLALQYAQTLVQLTPEDVLPYWARDLQVILLQDLGKQRELERLVGGLIANGKVTEAKEIEWLGKQLKKIDQ